MRRSPAKIGFCGLALAGARFPVGRALVPTILAANWPAR